MYKLIAVDMDGTLLNSEGKLSQITIDTVIEAINQGFHFILSTGRPIQGLQESIRILGLKGPMITYNGAMIVMAENNNILYQTDLDSEDARIILELGNKYETTMCFWSQNKLYVNRLDKRVNDYKKISGVEPILLNNYEEIVSRGITKILWYDTSDKLNEYIKRLNLLLKPTVSFCTSKPVFLEFFNSKVSKAEALKKIGEYYNIDKAEMIAVGDGFNDLPMLEYAGLGIAMDNAPDDLKKNMQYVAPSNDNNGVAEVIERFLLI